MTGTQFSSARSAATTSYPDSRGSITSSRTASYSAVAGPPPARPRRPPARSTVNPSAARPRRRACASRASSSTTSSRMPSCWHAGPVRPTQVLSRSHRRPRGTMDPCPRSLRPPRAALARPLAGGRAARRRRPGRRRPHARPPAPSLPPRTRRPAARRRAAGPPRRPLRHHRADHRPGAAGAARGRRRQRARSFSSLVSGSHTMRVWYAGPTSAPARAPRPARRVRPGPQRQRPVGLVEQEQHGHPLPPCRPVRGPHQAGGAPAPGAPTTPQQAADQALKAIDPTTAVSTDSDRGGGRAAGVPARADAARRTAPDRLRADRDRRRHPHPDPGPGLREAARPRPRSRWASPPSTRARPRRSVFGFTPPPGATVNEGSAARRPAAATPAAATGSRPSGDAPSRRSSARAGPACWSPRCRQDAAGRRRSRASRQPAAASSSRCPPCPAPGARATCCEGPLFSAVLTDDGRVGVGAVRPPRCTHALSARERHCRS